MKKHQLVLESGILVMALGLTAASPVWAAWGMKEEPQQQTAASPSTGSGGAESAAPDFKEVDQLAREDPGFALDMYRMAGERYLNRNKPAQAAAMFSQAIKMAPNNTQLMEGLADAQRAAGQKKEALEVWKSIIAGHNDIGYQLRYASFLEKIGEGAQSIEIMRAQAATRPDDSSFHYGIADAYGRQGKPADAVKELQAMLKAFPKEETEIKRRIAAMQPAPPAPKPVPVSKKQPPASVNIEAPSPVEVKAEFGHMEEEKKP